MAKFSNSDEARAWADEWVSERVPSEVMASIELAEAQHFEHFNAEYGRLVGQFEVQYAALVEELRLLNFLDKSAWPEHRAVQYVLLSYNVKVFRSALDRIMMGYYVDGITLTRGLYETFVRALFVSCYPDDAYNVLVGKPPKGTRPFVLTNFLSQDLGLEWETKYFVTSGFAHSNSAEALLALKRAQDREGEPELFGFRLEFSRRLAEASLPLLNFALLAHLRFSTDRLVGNSPIDADTLETAHDAVELLTFELRDHPKEYWRTVAEDLDLLFEMLEVADRREDWKAFLRMRRSVNPLSGSQ